MGKYLANFITYILHPLLMPTLLYLVVLSFIPEALQPMSTRISLYILALVFITTFTIPLLSVLGLRTTRSIRNLMMESKRERLLPFFFITIFYGLTTYLFHTKIEVNDFLISVFFGATLVAALITILTIFFKVSVHAAGMGCLTGSVLAMIYLFPEHNLTWLLSLVILLTGMVLSARLYLSAHSPMEVYGGFILGFLVCLPSVYFLS